MRVYLLRHGQTAWNAQGRYLGRTDLPLTEAGRAALREADLGMETVFVSPLGRAADPSEPAQMILFFASEAASFVNGEIGDCDGGIVLD